jgi:cytochrome d ubiquinol oxidase subunit I
LPHPLVCFGIAFPALVLFLEGLWLRTGDPLYKAIAKRWSKVMLIPSPSPSPS